MESFRYNKDSLFCYLHVGFLIYIILQKPRWLKTVSHWSQLSHLSVQTFILDSRGLPEQNNASHFFEMTVFVNTPVSKEWAQHEMELTHTQPRGVNNDEEHNTKVKQVKNYFSVE